MGNRAMPGTKPVVQIRKAPARLWCRAIIRFKVDDGSGRGSTDYDTDNHLNKSLK